MTKLSQINRPPQLIKRIPLTDGGPKTTFLHAFLRPSQEYVAYSHTGRIVPAIWFRYDLSPITVKYTERRQPFYRFITTVSRSRFTEVGTPTDMDSRQCKAHLIINISIPASVASLHFSVWLQTATSALFSPQQLKAGMEQNGEHQKTQTHAWRC